MILTIGVNFFIEISFKLKENRNLKRNNLSEIEKLQNYHIYFFSSICAPREDSI